MKGFENQDENFALYLEGNGDRGGFGVAEGGDQMY